MRTKVYGGIVAVAISILFAACATTEVATIRNPAVSNIQYDLILVSAPFTDLELRRNTEQAFVAELSDYGVAALPAIDVFPPLKQYSETEIADEIARRGVDAIMSVVITDYYEDQSYVPPTTTTTGSASVYGNTVYGQSTTQTHGGYYLSHPRVRFDINLFDGNVGEVAWRATTFTAGNAFANASSLMASLSRSVVLEYARDAGLQESSPW